MRFYSRTVSFWDKSIVLRNLRVYFNSCTVATTRLEMHKVTRIVAADLPFSYLGVPVFRGTPLVSHFFGITDSVLSRFGKWKGSSLSMASRVCLVNSVIAGALVHSMMVYRGPRFCISRMETAMT